MGNQASTEFNLSEKTTLIDFLYIDKEKVDSFLSQIQKGALRSVKKTNDITQGSSLSGEVSVPTLAKGTMSDTNQDKTSSEEQYDPYHSQLLDLVNFLSLPINNDIPETDGSQLVLLEAKISIRNLETLKKIIPIFRNNKEFFGFSNKSFQMLSKQLKIAEEMLSLMPLSIDIEAKFDSGLSIKGPLKESCLSVKSDDLFRSYGTTLPGKWFILGIIDKNEPIVVQPDNQSLYGMIDTISNGFYDLYSTSELEILPILVFRSVDP